MDPTLWQMAQPIVAGQFRHILTGIAGALVAKGAIQSDQEGAFVTIGLGIASYAAGAAWSWWQKYGQAAVKAQLAKLKARDLRQGAGSAPLTQQAVQSAMQNKSQ